MPQQKLDVSQTGPVFEEMGGAAMTKNVGGDADFEFSLLGIVMKTVANGIAAHPTPQRGDEKSWFTLTS